MTTFYPTNLTETDPVCGMKVDPHRADAQVCDDGRTVFFCSQTCRHKFELTPARYLAKKPKGKTFWQRYLERLTKATGGKAQSCCH